MYLRGIFAAFVALLVSATLVENAAAYPTTARSATATVTGLYRPLNLNLSLADNTSPSNYFYYTPQYLGFGGSIFEYSATYSGSYGGYGPSGLAGNWELSFQFFGDAFGPEITNDGTTITKSAPTDLTTPVGELRYIGGGDYSGLPYGDTPQVDDVFFFYATSLTDPLMQVTCQDGVATCESFTLNLLQDLKLLGPYQFQDCECDPIFEVARVNEECLKDSPDGPVANGPCGLVSKESFRVSSVPEPASLALVGLGLLGLTLVRRRQQRRHRV